MEPPRSTIRLFALCVLVALAACADPCEVGPAEPDDEEPAGVEWLEFGTYHVCVLDERHQVWCTGNNEAGQLGDGTTQQQDELVRVRDIDDATGMTVGLFDTSCAFNHEGRLWCWGSNEHGVLADEDLELSAEPVAVEGLPPVVDVAVGARHACGLTEEGRLYCWGSHARGQLGLGPEAGDVVTTPRRVVGLEDVADVGAGATHSCARTEGGRVYCWGSNDTGQLGADLEPRIAVDEPFDISGMFPEPVVDLEVGFKHSCGLVGERRRLYCWGANDYGQFGLDDLEARFQPVEVPEIAYVDDLAVGGGQVCVDIDERIYCAGEVMRPVEVARETGEGYLFRPSEALDRATELWSGVLAVCGPADGHTVACRGVEHRDVGGEMF